MEKQKYQEKKVIDRIKIGSLISFGYIYDNTCDFEFGVVLKKENDRNFYKILTVLSDEIRQFPVNICKINLIDDV